MNFRNKLIASTLGLGTTLGGIALGLSAPANASSPVSLPVLTPCQLTPQGCSPPSLVSIPPVISLPPGVTFPPVVTTQPPVISLPPINPCLLLPAGCKPPATVPQPTTPVTDPGGTDDCVGAPDGCGPEDQPQVDVPVKGRPAFTG